ncbi:MAG: hypothetical protein FWH55_11015 [Oscillospiraceae bacterium]|nr:hypothetical protein [Oscillospiraceae bacterium]
MLKINIQEIHNDLENFLVLISNEEEIILTYHEKPVAKLAAITAKPKRTLGFARGAEIPDSFFEPLSEEDLHV